MTRTTTGINGGCDTTNSPRRPNNLPQLNYFYLFLGLSLILLWLLMNLHILFFLIRELRSNPLQYTSFRSFIFYRKYFPEKPCRLEWSWPELLFASFAFIYVRRALPQVCFSRHLRVDPKSRFLENKLGFQPEFVPLFKTTTCHWRRPIPSSLSWSGKQPVFLLEYLPGKTAFLNFFQSFVTDTSTASSAAFPSKTPAKKLLLLPSKTSPLSNNVVL